MIELINESYKEYIDKIKEARENKKILDEYMEIHHILPKSCEGSDEEDNLIYLFPQEHYYCHKLLALENPDNLSL